MKIKDSWHLPDRMAAAKRTRQEVPVISGMELSEAQKVQGKGKKYWIFTYGCQANERDSETLAGILSSMSYEKAENVSQADVILLNTCGIRENAANTVLGELGSCKQYWRANPDLVLGICGCMVQEEGFALKILEKYPWVRLLFGTHNLQDLPNMLERAENHERVAEIYSREGEVYEDFPVERNSKTKAWVNIMYGCDKFCTYCIVPYTRGKQRSRSAKAVLDEVNVLKKLGYKEITLLGQNVNAYGKDLEQEMDFAGLLEECARTGIPRIRFMTSHPWDFSQDMIDVIAKYPNIMPYIHLPLQSGDDGVLARMGRRYSSQDYLSLFKAIKEKISGVSVSTDIIVGFPNESDEAFEHTLDLVRECRFDNAFTFIYSPRPGTPAARMDDPTAMDVKKERLQRLNTLWNELANEDNQKLTGTVMEVLVDGPSRKNPDVFSGYSDTGKPVNIRLLPGQKPLQTGDIVPVRIETAHTFSLNGVLENGASETGHDGA